MPNPKNPHSYPAEYQDIAEGAPYILEPLIFDCETPQRAKVMQGRWYSYIRSLERAVFNKRGQDEDPKRIAGGRSLSVSVQGSQLIFTPRHMTKEAEILSKGWAAFTARPEAHCIPQGGFTVLPEVEEPDYTLHHIPSNDT